MAVAVERMREQENGVTEIHAIIFCERDSHKGIIIERAVPC